MAGTYSKPDSYNPHSKKYKVPTRIGSGGNIEDEPPPPGYHWDEVGGGWIPNVGSPARTETLQDKVLKAALEGLNISTSTSTSTGSGGGGGGFPPVTFPGGGGPTYPGAPGGNGGVAGGYPGLQAPGGGGGYDSITPIDTTEAENAAFGRAKDKVGQISSGALIGLRSSLGGRGMLGSGAESRGTQSVVNAGQASLGDTVRQQAITASENAQKNAQANFEGQVTERGQNTVARTAERGQDVTARTAANTLLGENQRAQFGGGVTSRGQDVDLEIARRNNATSLAVSKQSPLLGLLGSFGKLY